MIMTMLTLRVCRRSISWSCVLSQSAWSSQDSGRSAIRMQQQKRFISMENFIQKSCNEHQVPGAVVMAADRTGDFIYKNVFRSDTSQADSLTEDSIMWIASCTKLITSIAAMQCVENGLVTLDEDLRRRIPELDAVDIIQTDDQGRYAGQSKNETPITLRQLLTHTSGFAYEFNTPSLQDWRKLPGNSHRPTSMRKRFQHPLIFQPGTNWAYGPSIDWVGAVIEQVSSSSSLQDYMIRNIWEPLGIRDMTFFLSERPDLQAKRATMSQRVKGSAAVSRSERQPCFEPDLEDCTGGGGIYTSTSEYFKVLRALLKATGNTASDGSDVPPSQILRRSTALSMFEPNLGDGAREAVMQFSSVPFFNHMMGNMPLGTKKDHALGGLLVQDDLAGWRSKGTLTWGGTPNLTWWIDPVVGICGIYASQLLPIGDAKTNEMVHAFEKSMYERYAEHQKAHN